MSRNSPVVVVNPQTGDRPCTNPRRSLHSFAAFSVKALLLFAAFFVLFLQAKAQVQGWKGQGASCVSAEDVLLR
jgi:hypothetical protein